MTLITQIKSLLFSFCFGVFFSFAISMFEKIIYHKKIVYQIINTFLISIFFCLLYFIFIKKINFGIIHIYFILMVLLGMFLDIKLFRLGARIKKLTSHVKFKNKK